MARNKITHLINQKGIGGILILTAIGFIIIAVIAMIYFLTKGQDQKFNQQTENQTKTTITEDQVPLKVCETGDPEQCNDPVPNSVVDKVKVDDLP
jgi:hypothetical protein